MTSQLTTAIDTALLIQCRLESLGDDEHAGQCLTGMNLLIDQLEHLRDSLL